MRLYLLVFFIVCSSLWGRAFAIDTLYIVKKELTYNGTSFQKAAIADSIIQVQYDNAILQVGENQADSFLLINTDTMDYSLELNTNNSFNWLISAEDTLKIEFPGLTQGTHAIIATNEVGDLLGAACIIQSGIIADHIYSWDLWDINTVLSQEVASTMATGIPSSYRPDIFAINASPVARMDTSNALIYGNVGDTIKISVLNSGNMTHNLHFHGYHVTLLQSSHQPDRVGWSKDSFPVFEHETMTILLVPDQPGVYPVHNHNLVTTIFNNSYPKGMMSMMKIQP